MLNLNYTKIKKLAVFAAGIVGAYCATSLFVERRKKNELPEKVDESLETEDELLEEEAEKEEVEVS